MVHSISSSSIGDSSSPSPSPVIFKRKRSKRYRILAPPPSNSAIATASSASSNTTEEDHDMANCLMLLAQGPPVLPFKESAAPLLKPTTVPTTVYECKTCNKCFSSFQALGGHRASHKKPKLTPLALETELLGSIAKPIASPSSSAAGKKRIHQCSVCGAEFSSGQALGGHMRRHRPALLLENRLETNRTENKVLLLDLNLPAPADDDDGGSRSQLLDY